MPLFFPLEGPGSLSGINNSFLPPCRGFSDLIDPSSTTPSPFFAREKVVPFFWFVFFFLARRCCPFSLSALEPPYYEPSDPFFFSERPFSVPLRPLRGHSLAFQDLFPSTRGTGPAPFFFLLLCPGPRLICDLSRPPSPFSRKGSIFFSTGTFPLAGNPFFFSLGRFSWPVFGSPFLGTAFFFFPPFFLGPFLWSSFFLRPD